VRIGQIYRILKGGIIGILSPVMLEALGLIGVAFYLGSYAMLQFGLLDGQSYSYAILNIIAPALVLVSLGQAFNLSATIIQVLWVPGKS
jgi:hypothetical protein